MLGTVVNRVSCRGYFAAGLRPFFRTEPCRRLGERALLPATGRVVASETFIG